MLLSRASRCVPGHVLSPGSIRATANGLRDVTGSLRKTRTFLGYRCFRVTGDLSSHLRLTLGSGRVTPLTSGGHAALTGSWWSRTMQPCRSSSTSPGSQTRPEDQNQNPKQDPHHVSSQVEQNVQDRPTSSAQEADPGAVKPTKAQQLKKVFKEYGAVGVSFHVGISLMSLGMFYLLVSSGLDVVHLLSKLGLSEAIIRSKMAAGTSTFVLAYAIHKLFAPVRISITLVSVPLIVRYLRKTGLFKPPTHAP